MRKLVWFLPALFIILFSFFAPAAKQDLSQAFCAISSQNILGCSPLGESLFGQLIAGLGETSLIAMSGRLLSLLFAICSLTIVFFAKQGGMYSLFQRLAEALLTIPSLLLALAFQSTMGGGAVAMIAAIAVSEWAVNHKWLQTRLEYYNRETFMAAAIVFGANFWLRLRLHLMPHLWHDIIFLFFTFLPGSFLTVSALEFLGFSIGSHRDGLGYLVAANKDYIFSHPHLAAAPAITLVLLILYFTGIKNKFFKAPS